MKKGQRVKSHQIANLCDLYWKKSEKNATTQIPTERSHIIHITSNLTQMNCIKTSF